MDRRHAILTLSGVIATGGLLASARRPVLAQAPAPGQPVVADILSESQYRKQTLAAGTFSKQSSELAAAQATHPKVKQFAQFETNEQATIAQALTDSNDPEPAALDPDHTALLQALRSQSGKPFDLAYVQGQIDGHHELYIIQQGFLNGLPTDRDYKHIAMLARTTIQMHLTMLTDLQSLLTAA